MRRLTALAALLIACLLAGACGSTHHTSTSRPAPKAEGRPVIQSPAAIRSDGTSRQYGSAAAPKVKETLTTTESGRTGSPPIDGYQWQDCSSGGTHCANIAGATSTSYTVQTSDVGDTIRVAVTAKRTGDSFTAYSAVTGVVAPDAPGNANITRFNITDDTDAVTIANAAQYQIVQLQYSSTVKTLVDQIHADDPGVKVLMYSDPSVAGTGGSQDGWTTCTTLTQDSGNDAWYLYDGTTRIDSKMNLGDSAYQSTCISSAIARAKSADFDGIFWDEINPVSTYGIANTCINAYQAASCSLYDGSSNTAWQANTYSFVRAVGAASSSAGMDSILNDGSGTTAQWEQWASVPGIAGSMEESFAGSVSGTSIPYWRWQIELADEVWSEAHDKYLMGLHYDPNQNQESLDTFGLSTMLLAANGYSSYNSTVTTLNQGSYDWWPEYTTALDLGAPTGAYTTVTSGSATVYERKFANGIVVVNPTTSSSEKVPLGGNYTGTGNEPDNVSSVTLPAQTGLVLTNGS